MITYTEVSIIPIFSVSHDKIQKIQISSYIAEYDFLWQELI